MKINTGEYNIFISEVSKVIDTNNLNSKNSSLSPEKNDVCEVIIHSSQLIPMDDFKDNQKTGRFCILDEEKIIAGGIINLQNFPDQKDVIQTKNIKPVSFSVTEIDRALRFNHRSAIIWMTGLSGSGKSTIAKEIEKKLFLKNYNVFVLDGDNLRAGINRGLGFTTEDRTENIRRTAEVARLLKEKKVSLPFGLYITNSVQEEIGLRGAEMITNTIKPNVAIVTDVCHDTSTPMIENKKEGDIKIGQGPVISYAPAVHNSLREKIIKTADSKKIPFQRLASSRYTGTDTDAFAYSNGGVPSALISLPLRYMHTTVEMVQKEDIENVIKLIFETLKNIKSNESFSYFK